ncbi:hypothetical protein D3C87_1943670 [compost metagenome]
MLAGGVSAKPPGDAFTVFLINRAGDAGGFFALNIHDGNAVTCGGKPTAEKLS